MKRYSVSVDESTYNQIQALAKHYHCPNSKVFDQVLKEREMIWESFESYLGKVIDTQLKISLNKEIDSFVRNVLGKVLTKVSQFKKESNMGTEVH